MYKLQSLRAANTMLQLVKGVILVGSAQLIRAFEGCFFFALLLQPRLQAVDFCIVGRCVRRYWVMQQVCCVTRLCIGGWRYVFVWSPLAFVVHTPLHWATAGQHS